VQLGVGSLGVAVHMSQHLDVFDPAFALEDARHNLLNQALNAGHVTGAEGMEGIVMVVVVVVAAVAAAAVAVVVEANMMVMTTTFIRLAL
jgi:hypothetical protein